MGPTRKIKCSIARYFKQSVNLLICNEANFSNHHIFHIWKVIGNTIRITVFITPFLLVKQLQVQWCSVSETVLTSEIMRQQKEVIFCHLSSTFLSKSSARAALLMISPSGSWRRHRFVTFTPWHPLHIEAP
uniref:Ovule protein n=1 Tax=Ascaris lumbricoides TaxID=6252 RepID=A0A0M3I551_ASCLU